MLNDLKFNDKYEQKVFETICKDNRIVNALKLFSVSDDDLDLRVSAYVKSIAFTSRLEDAALRNGAKRSVLKFAAAPGATAANLRGTTLYPATILNYVSSISSIFAVERDVATPMADLQFIDFYSLLTGNSIVPNLGKDADFGNNMYETSTPVNSTSYTFNVQDTIVANTVIITAVIGGTVMVIKDDGEGHLMALPGVLSGTNTVNYSTGAITVTFTNAPDSSTEVNLHVTLDTPASDEVDKLAGEVKYFHVDTAPIFVPLIRNIVTDAALNKQGVIDPNTIYTNLITAQYTKATNLKCVKALVEGFTGNAHTCDLSSFSLAAGEYSTLIRAFQAVLIDGESLLGQQTYKGAKCTGYLAGRKIANLFQYMNADEGWVPNNQLGYFKDLVGWYKGVPVVRWEGDKNDPVQIGETDLYMTHKTLDGQLAPVARAMFVTPTDLPEVGNFKNASQIADGMFSIEGFAPTSPKLTLKITFTLPSVAFLV